MTKDFEPTDFAPEYGNDIYEPDDGRDSQAYEGSSDSPETMRNIDPLATRAYLLDDDLETEAQLDNEFTEESNADEDED
ncbi:hypothetical protein CQ010_15835 [Arthrobacter sp. MYb211]|uniref:hypothetical protein n=1 Tax=Micrococcaceae TaxID=1268 RepID=UPI000BB77B78|nr:MULTISPECIES: hypothetical protein [Micrococcaceae]PCC28429.1 hypothetical protein CIK76_11955 [Glutamicibacter sp. BW80]PQZ96861.1 hypothetical protein CQ017_15865 [Arthrobacter sp. MYb224]PQZ98007.1 hypothetical protein CQ019_17410 [Arthrobacter sp. MYb229]PRA10064.1 hypothetical protein CQ015_15820 [Arthrobacter sp. MYb221]PRB46889.1 hypothetical protein CQ013_17435 [Arthrobacter sp. MYb216]